MFRFNTDRSKKSLQKKTVIQLFNVALHINPAKAFRGCSENGWEVEHIISSRQRDLVGALPHPHSYREVYLKSASRRSLSSLRVPETTGPGKLIGAKKLRERIFWLWIAFLMGNSVDKSFLRLRVISNCKRHLGFLCLPRFFTYLFEFS